MNTGYCDGLLWDEQQTVTDSRCRARYSDGVQAVPGCEVSVHPPKHRHHGRSVVWAGVETDFRRGCAGYGLEPPSFDLLCPECRRSTGRAARGAAILAAIAAPEPGATVRSQ